MLQQLGEEIKEGEKPNLTIDDEIACFGGLYPGTKVAPSSNIFPRIDTKAMLELLEKESKAEMEKAAAAKKVAEGAADAKKDEAVLPNVTFDQFKACDLRAGTVKVCEKLPKSDRILRLMIDFGEGQPRQILSGLAEFYKPEELVGRQVIAVLNLEPRKIRGAMSNGMVLTAEKDGKLTLIAPSVPMPDGSRIG
jgi:methionyl-tRNA synthetase